MKHFLVAIGFLILFTLSAGAQQCDPDAIAVVYTKFVENQWQAETLGERFARVINEDIETATDLLCTLDRSSLRETLFQIDPMVSVSYWNVNELDQLKVFIETEMDGKPLPERVEKIATERHWRIPRNYNCWSMTAKRRYVEKCLSSNAGHRGGTNLSKLRSSIVEAFLKGSV